MIDPKALRSPEESIGWIWRRVPLAWRSSCRGGTGVAPPTAIPPTISGLNVQKIDAVLLRKVVIITLKLNGYWLRRYMIYRPI